MFRRLTGILTGAVMAVAVLLLLLMGIGPHLFGYRTLTMLSGSMRPEYPTGSVVIDTSIPSTSLKVGDILTYHIPVLDHHVESHRVTSIRKGANGLLYITTKGDANSSADPWVAELTPARVWIVRADIPDLGYVIGAVRTPVVLDILRFAVPGMALMWFLNTVWRKPIDLITQEEEIVKEEEELSDALSV